MNPSNPILQMINFDHLYIGIAFVALTFAFLAQARRTQPALANLSVVAFGYCAAVQLARFVLQLIDAQASPLRDSLSTLYMWWPAIFIVGAATALASSLRAARTFT